MTEFEPLTSGIGSNRCTNWATTTALKQRLSMRVQIAMLILLLANSFYCVYRSPKTFYAMVYETHSPPKGLLQEALTWWLFQIGISVAGNSLLYLGMELFSSWRWRLDRPKQRAVVFMLKFMGLTVKPIKICNTFMAKFQSCLSVGPIQLLISFN